MTTPQTLQTKEHKQTELVELPNEWKQSALNNEQLFGFENGLWTGKKEPFRKIYVLRNTNFNNNGKISYNNVAEILVEEKQFSKRTLQYGDILLERSGGGPAQPVGRVVFFDKKDESYSYSNFTSRLRIVDNQNDAKYILYFLLYFYKTGGTRPLQTATTGIRNLNFTAYKEIIIPLPPISEQQNIAFVLSTVQNAQESSEQTINSLKELKKSLMKHLFTYGAVSFEDTDKVKLKETEIGMMPEGWKEKKIKDFCKILTGGTPKTDIKDYYLPQEVMWMKSGEIQGRRIKKINTFISKKGLENSNARMLPKNTVVIALAGRGKTRGTTAILEVECACNQSVVCMVPNAELSNQFLHYYLSNIYRYIRNLTGDEDRTGLNKEIVGNLPLFLPSFQEQQQIAHTISILDDEIEFEERKLCSLNELLNSLLKDLMTAKVRVKDLAVQK